MMVNTGTGDGGSPGVGAGAAAAAAAVTRRTGVAVSERASNMRWRSKIWPFF